MRKQQIWSFVVFLSLAAAAANAQSFMVQCPSSTPLHPGPNGRFPLGNASSGLGYDPASQSGTYTGPVTMNENVGGVPLTYTLNGGGIKCQEISGGDGMMTEADGNQTFMFSFGPLSGMELIKNGQPGTQFAADFNNFYNAPTLPSTCDPRQSPASCSINPNALAGDPTADPTYDPSRPISLNGAVVDPAAIMQIGVINGNIPMPMAAFDEDDEFFLTLTNVGMIMRPDLFEEHTVHFHGYPNASSFYDGVPDATWAINIGGSATYYYFAPDAGTYFYHCHITPPEHLQMGMVGQLYVRPRQNRALPGTDLYQVSQLQQNDLRTACFTSRDILCSTPPPIADAKFAHQAGFKYAYNDGDGSTRYDIDVPIQIHGFDPNFHFVGMTFNPEGFADMKDKYFLLNGRSYPDTIGVPGYSPSLPPAPAPGACATPTSAPSYTFTTNPDQCSGAQGTEDTDGRIRYSQPLSTLITLSKTGGPGGIPQRALLRISDLDVTEYQTLASLGIPMTMVGFQAKLLRDQAGNNLYQTTNSITIGGGESLDVILDSAAVPPGTYFLYTSNLDHLSNDAENFGGLMTEVVVTQ